MFASITRWLARRQAVDVTGWMQPQDVVAAYRDRSWAQSFARAHPSIIVSSSPDGDSGKFQIPDLKLEAPFRASGFDCLESAQHGFERGRDFVYSVLVGKQAYAINFGQDDHGRQLMEIFFDYKGEIRSLSEVMISNGFAVLYDGIRAENHPFRRPTGDGGSRLLPERNEPFAQHLQNLEDVARMGGEGIWGDEFVSRYNNPFTLPGFFRSKINTNWVQLCKQRGMDPRGRFKL